MLFNGLLMLLFATTSSAGTETVTVSLPTALGLNAAKVTIVEVEELVEVGELDPDKIMTPSVYVQRIFQGTDYEKRIERRTLRKA